MSYYREVFKLILRKVLCSAEPKSGKMITIIRSATKSCTIKRYPALKDPFDGQPVKWNRNDIKMLDGYYECTLKAGEELKTL